MWLAAKVRKGTKRGDWSKAMRRKIRDEPAMTAWLCALYYYRRGKPWLIERWHTLTFRVASPLESTADCKRTLPDGCDNPPVRVRRWRL